MPPGERIAVVGAGIIGCAIAFELARRGAAVTIFDSRNVGAGATQASAGILAPYTEAHAGGPLFDLTVRGLRAYDAFVARVRASASTPFEYRKSGTIELAQDGERTRALRARLDVPWSDGAGLEWLDADALRALEPRLGLDFSGGLLCRTHAYVAVGAFTAAIVEAAAAHGVKVRTSVRVNGLEPGDRGIRLHTSDGFEQAHRTVLCAGSWAGALDPFGELAGRIRPVRGQLVCLRQHGAPVRYIFWSRNCYIVPWEDGTLLVGATAEEAGFDERATVDAVQSLLGAAREVLPGVQTATFEGVRVGLRPATDDGLPIIGPSRIDARVLYATGHFRNGVLLAPLTAEIIADHLNGA